MFTLLVINFIGLDLWSTNVRETLTPKECKYRVLKRNGLPDDFLPFDKDRVEKADRIVIKYFKKMSEKHMEHISPIEIFVEPKQCAYEDNVCLARFFRYSCFHLWGLVNYFENQRIIPNFDSMQESAETLENDIVEYGNKLISSKEKQKHYIAIGRAYMILSELSTDSLEQKNEYMQKSWKNFSNIRNKISKTIYLWKAQLLGNGFILQKNDVDSQQWDDQKNNQENTKAVYDDLLNKLNTTSVQKERKNTYKHTRSSRKKRPMLPFPDQFSNKRMKDQFFELPFPFQVQIQNNMNQQVEYDDIDGESLNSEELKNIPPEENNNLYEHEENQAFLQHLNQQVEYDDIDGESLNSEELENILRGENNNDNGYQEEEQQYAQEHIEYFNNHNNENISEENSNSRNIVINNKRKNNKKVDLEGNIEYIRNKAEKGKSTSKIAAKLGCNPTRLKKFMDEKGIKITKTNTRQTKSWTVQTLFDAYVSYKMGAMTQREISNTYKIGASKISSNFKKLDKINQNNKEELQNKIREIVENQINK